MTGLHTQHHHCQCDNCTGEDCGQDNPEELKKEQEREQREHDATIAAKVREELLEELISDPDCYIGYTNKKAISISKLEFLRNPQERERE